MPVLPDGTIILDDAPNDDIHYGRHKEQWAPVVEEAPNDPGVSFVRQNHEWVAAAIPTAEPTVTEIVPAIANVGFVGNITAHIFGANFTATTEVLWDTTVHPTTVVSPNELTITVTPALGTAPSVATVTVRDSATGLPGKGAAGFHFVASGGNYNFDVGLTHDDATGNVNLTPAGVAPALLGGVYVPTRDATQAADVDTNGGDGRLVVLTATDVLLGGMLEPVKDGTPYERQWNETAQVWEWVKPTATATDYGTGLSYDATQTPPIVNLQPAQDAPNAIGGVYVIDRERNVSEGLELGLDGRLRAPLATDALAGTLLEPPPDDKGYVRRRTAAGVSAWVPPADTVTDYGTGLSYDETATPPIVNLQPALDTAIGGIMEPGQDGLAYSRQFDTLTQTWKWVPALTAGLQITSIIPDKAIYGPTEPPLTVHVYGSEFTTTTIVYVDANPAATTYVSPTELTFVMNPAVPINDQFHIITVQDPAAVPPALTIGLGAEQFDFIKATTEVDYGTGLALDTAPTPPIVNLQPAQDAPNAIGGVYVIDRERNVSEGLELGIDGRLRAPLATPRLAGTIVEPEDDGKGYVRTTLNGVSAWVPPADTPPPFAGLGLSMDTTAAPPTINLQPAGWDNPLFLGGIYGTERSATNGLDISGAGTGFTTAPLATDVLAGTFVEPPKDGVPYERRWNETAQVWEWVLAPGSTHYGIGLSFDDTTRNVDLQPAGDAPATLGGVYVIDRERNVSEGLELGLDGRLRAPLATPRLAGTIVEPEDDSKGYVRTTVAGVSMWVPPATTPYHFVTGLSHDDTTGDVNLQPAADSPAGLGGVYVVERTRTAFQGLELNGDGELKAPLASDLLAGTFTEPPPDGLAYSRQWDNVTDPANPKWVWVPALSAGLQITGLIPDKAILGPTEPVVTVHAFGSQFTPTTVIVVDGSDASATTYVSPTELTFQMNPAVPIGEVTHVITVRDPAATPPEGLGAESFEFIKSSTTVEYGIGLTLDTTTTPDPTVNLNVANANGGEIGGVKLIGRSPNQGLEYDIATGTLWAPLATDVAAGSIVEPPPDGSQYVRTRSMVGFSEWIKSTASGVIIADAPPDVAMTPPGTLWWESDSGDLFIMYDDGNSKQWVEAVAGADPGVKTHIGDVPPATANPGDLWWDSDAGTLAIYYQDADSTQWVQVGGPQPPATGGGLADAPADGTEYLRKDNAWVNPVTGAFLPLAGGTLTGNLTISKSTAELTINAVGVNYAAFNFKRDDNKKFDFQLLGGTGEPHDLSMWSYDDAQAGAEVFKVGRANRIVNFANRPTVAGTPIVLQAEHDAALAKIAELEARLVTVEALAAQIRGL